jgi:hypothetical protein
VSRIVVETSIPAPIERVFDVARDIGVHVASQAGRREEAIARAKVIGRIAERDGGGA